MRIRDPNQEIAEVFFRLNAGAVVESEILSQAFRLILTNPNVKARDIQLGAMLTGLMVRGPTVGEVITLIRTALNIDGLTRYRPVLPPGEKLIGVAGSGKKGFKTFNISTTACLVASAAGAYVAKPGSAATSSVSGSKDFINAVGARTIGTNEMIETLLATKFGMFTIEELIPKFDAVYGGKMFCPTPLSFALPAVVNPIACDALLYGLSHPNISLAHDVFVELGYKNFMVVVSSHDRVHFIDELSTVEHNFVGKAECGNAGSIEEISVSEITQQPSSHPDVLCSGDSLIENVQIAIKILKGKSPGPCEDTVALNAAGILVLAGKSPTLAEGFKLATETIRNGAGFQKLGEFVNATGGSNKALEVIAGG